MFCFHWKTVIFLWKNSAKKTEVFQNSYAWMALLEKRITLASRIYSWKKIKFFERFIVWLFCLDEIEKLASHFFLFYFR